MNNGTVNDQAVATQTGSDYASLTQAERHARAANRFTEEDLAEALRRIAEPSNVKLGDNWKQFCDYRNDRRRHR